jgi:hypothetical protein
LAFPIDQGTTEIHFSFICFLKILINEDGDWKNDPPKLFIINHYKEKRAIELKIVLKAAQ